MTTLMTDPATLRAKIGRALMCAQLEAYHGRAMIALTSQTVTGQAQWDQTSWGMFLDCIRSFYGIPVEAVLSFLNAPIAVDFGKISDSPPLHGLALYGTAYPSDTEPDATVEDQGRPNTGELAIGPDDYPLD